MTAPRLATLEQARDTGRTTVSNRTALPGDLDLPRFGRPQDERWEVVLLANVLHDHPAGRRGLFELLVDQGLQADPKVSELFDPGDGPVYIGALGVNGRGPGGGGTG